MTTKRATVIGGALHWRSLLHRSPRRSRVIGITAAMGCRGYGGQADGYGYEFNPVVGLATALVGVAVAIVTAPIAIVAAVATRTLLRARPGLSAGPAAYNAPPEAQGYYGAPTAPAVLRPPAPLRFPPPPLLRPPAATFNSPPVTPYYAAPVATYYGRRRPALFTVLPVVATPSPRWETTRTTTAFRPAPMVRPRGNTTIDDKPPRRMTRPRSRPSAPRPRAKATATEIPALAVAAGVRRGPKPSNCANAFSMPPRRCSSPLATVPPPSRP